MTRIRSISAVPGVMTLSLFLTSCTTAGELADPPDGQGSVSVVASTTILGSIVGEILACGGGEVVTLIPVGADPHDYSPSSADVAGMVNANVVVTNGLGLEEGLSSALTTAREDGATVWELGPRLEPLPLTDATDSPDPHVWMDVSRMATAASLIGTELASLTSDEQYTTCGQDVADALMVTDDRVRGILQSVPPSRRVLVTDHDAFGYFTTAYGYTSAGVVIPGGSTLGQPSSSELAALANAVQDAGVSAIFANTANPTALMEALAQEAGTQIAVVELYVGSLGGEGSGATTYHTMMLTNAQRIADALTD